MLKTTSLVSVIAVGDLLYAAQAIYAVNFKTIPLLITASIWYLVCTSLLYVGQYYLERYYGRGATRGRQPTALQKIRLNILSIRHEGGAR
jgi:polar amino acid transport system permease protein